MWLIARMRRMEIFRILYTFINVTKVIEGIAIAYEYSILKRSSKKNHSLLYYRIKYIEHPSDVRSSKGLLVIAIKRRGKGSFRKEAIFILDVIRKYWQGKVSISKVLLFETENEFERPSLPLHKFARTIFCCYCLWRTKTCYLALSSTDAVDNI